MNDTHDGLGSLVMRARVAVGIATRAEFARRLGVEARTVYRIEKGVSKPSFDTLVAIARETGRPLEYFTAADESPNAAA